MISEPCAETGGSLGVFVLEDGWLAMRPRWSAMHVSSDVLKYWERDSRWNSVINLGRRCQRDPVDREDPTDAY